MRLKIIACGVFKPYIENLIKKTEHQVEVTFLDAGLHETPNLLREKVQEEINKSSKKVAGHNKGDCEKCKNPCIKFDYIVIFYGLCGRGVIDLTSYDVPLVLPRVHDCISLFLGSNTAYKKEFSANPGTFYHTLGWITEKINPKNKEANELYTNYDINGYEKHPNYYDYNKQFGHENAEFILKFHSNWVNNYNRCAYIDLGLENEIAYSELTKYMAKTFNLNFQVIKGDLDYIKALFNVIDDNRITIIPPHSKVMHTGDEKIFSYKSEDEKENSFYTEEVTLKDISNNTNITGVGLGIDAGGTYTDAVIYDFNNKNILAKAKSPTTYEDLLIGIKNVLELLPKNLIQNIKVTALSTTLATNSIVEGRGYKVGLISYSPFDWFEEKIEHSPMVKVKGAITIDGEITEEINKTEIIKACKELIINQKCKAIAVGGYGSIRNPSLSNAIREIINENYPDILVVCSHDLSNKLNAVNSLRTAISNARLVPIISELIRSIKLALKSYNIPDKLLVVKGDGSNIDCSVALERPIETILSGPAASVSGASILTNLKNAIVLDIGGTTTDTAIIKNYHVEVSDDGATVGNWVMNIDAAKISTTGLGGDSRIDFNRERKIILGPQRNIPFCHIASTYPQILNRLKEISKKRLQTSHNAKTLDVLVKSNVLNATTELENKVLETLDKAPMFAIDLYKELDLKSMELLNIDKLEKKGVVKRVSLTPTDIMHIDGDFNNWNKEASKLALSIFAKLYGKDEDTIKDLIYKEINKRILSEIISRELSDEIGKGIHISKESYYMIDKILNNDSTGLSVKFSLEYPIVGIGAPTKTMFKNLEKYINAKIIVPKDADVANAVGAISGKVVVKENAIIKQGVVSNYIIFTRNKRIEANSLEEATNIATNIIEENSLLKASYAGAINPSIKICAKDNISTTSDGGKLFIERNVYGVASGSAVGI